MTGGDPKIVPTGLRLLLAVVFVGLLVQGLRGVADGDWTTALLAGLPGLIGLGWLAVEQVRARRSA